MPGLTGTARPKGSRLGEAWMDEALRLAVEGLWTGRMPRVRKE